MRCTFLLLFLFLLTSAPVYGQVKADTFDLKTNLNNENLALSISTDLPDDTELMISVARSYWEEGSSTEYSINYLSEKSTVGKWKNEQNITVDNNKWESDLKQKQEKFIGTDLGFNIGKISDSIRVSATVPINQNNPKFGERNSKLRGEVVNTDGLRTIYEEVVIFYPLEGISQESKFANPRSLKVDKVYTLSDQTPLMSEFSPSDPMTATENTTYLYKSDQIHILEKKEKNGQPWYKVEAWKENGERIDQGWINSTALINQKLKVQ